MKFQNILSDRYKIYTEVFDGKYPNILTKNHRRLLCAFHAFLLLKIFFDEYIKIHVVIVTLLAMILDLGFYFIFGS